MSVPFSPFYHDTTEVLVGEKANKDTKRLLTASLNTFVLDAYMPYKGYLKTHLDVSLK